MGRNRATPRIGVSFCPTQDSLLLLLVVATLQSCVSLCLSKVYGEYQSQGLDQDDLPGCSYEAGQSADNVAVLW